ncbi:helix-turn-helix domain-containing protein [Kitasatospora sp. NPDC004614]|uniref:helix-turn-helix domain-containing protein n=1 Tax=unclassified Kitasatospora TaxID=2633591 RepID=UPI0036B2F852
MARRQAPLEGNGAAARFAERLREVRRESGLTLRQLAAISGYSHSTLSLAENGRRLPSWDVVAAFVQACGRKDIDRWRGWWDAAEEQSFPAVEGPEPEAPTIDPQPMRVPEPEPVVVVRTRWWALLLAVLLSSALTATVTLLLVPARSDGSKGHAALAGNFPPGSDPIPSEDCGGGAPGYGCQHKDPNATPCWGEGVQQGHVTDIEYEGQVIGKVVNWYSPRCGTNWSALHLPAGWRGRTEIVSQTDKMCFPADCQSLEGKTPPFWTPMVFGMNQPVVARGYVEYPDGQIRMVTAGTT